MAVDRCFPPDLQTSLMSRRSATVMRAPRLRLSRVLCVSSQQAGRGQSGNPAAAVMDRASSHWPLSRAYDLGGEKGISVPRGVGMGDLSEHVADSASQRAGQLSRGDLEPGLVCLRKLGMASVAAASWAGGKWWEEAAPV